MRTQTNRSDRSERSLKTKDEKETKTRYPGVKMIRPGTFAIRATVTDPRTGKQRETEKRVRARTAQEASIIRSDLLRELDAGQTAQSGGHLTVSTVAAEWLETKGRARRPDGSPRLVQSTIDRYDREVRTWILPFLGEHRVAHLKRSDLERWRDAIGSELRAATVNGILRTFRTMLREGADTEVIVRGLEEDDTRITEEQPNLLAPDQVRVFLEAAKTHEPDHYPLIFWIVITGMRIGTALTMRWDDLDPERSIAIARRRVSGGKVIEGVKRGRGSRDVVPVTPELLRVLMRAKASYSPRQLESGWIFPSHRGGLRSRSHLGAVIKGLTKTTGLEGFRLTPHGVRRTSSLLYRTEASEAVAGSILGHGLDMVRHYSPVQPGEKVAAAARVSGIALGSSENPGINGATGSDPVR